MSATTYDVEHFLNKFRAIPEELWLIGCYSVWTKPQSHCALGHCGRDIDFSTDESNGLAHLFFSHGLRVTNTNDGLDDRFPQPTPKQRIIAALEFIKEKGTV